MDSMIVCPFNLKGRIMTEQEIQDAIQEIEAVGLACWVTEFDGVPYIIISNNKPGRKRVTSVYDAQSVQRSIKFVLNA